jgi:hypothetical protein
VRWYDLFRGRRHCWTSFDHLPLEDKCVFTQQVLALEVSGSASAYAKALTVLEKQRRPVQTELSLGRSRGDTSMQIKPLF